MPRVATLKCKVSEFDIVMYCRRNSVDNSYIDEPYYVNGELAGMHRLLIPLCQSHYDWINRDKTQYDLDYKEWLKQYG